MKNIYGAVLGLTGGIFYLLCALVRGGEGGSLVASIVWVPAAILIIFVVITVLVFWFPPSRIWLYPLMFALPTLLIGLIALADKTRIFTVAAIGSATFLVGLGAARIVRKHAKNRPPRAIK